MPQKAAHTAQPPKQKPHIFTLNPVLIIMLFTVSPLVTGLLINMG